MTFKPQFCNNTLNFCSILILFFFCCKGFSQSKKTYFIPDSLKGKSYKELYKQQNIYWSKRDTINTLFYAKMYLHKAKNEKDTIKIANGYSQHINLSKFEIGIEYADSIISITKLLKKNKIYPGYGYMIKGMYHYYLSNYNKSINHFLIAKDYAIKNNNEQHLSYIDDGIGAIKMFWGNYNEAIVHFKSQLNYLTKNDKTTFDQYNYLLTLSNLSNCYINLKQLDSASFYNRKGLKKSIEKKDEYWYRKFIKQSGYVLYYKNDFKAALDSINKGVLGDDLSNHYLNTNYYKGKIYNKLNDSLKAFHYLKEADSIYNVYPEEITPEVRDVQEYFVKYYARQKDVDSQLIYVNRLLHVDSIIDSYKKELNETIIKEYDRPRLLAEKQSIINSLEKSKTKSNNTIIGLIIGLLVVIVLAIRFYYLQYLYKKRFNTLINTKEEEIVTVKPKEDLQGVSKEIVASILSQLETFEANTLFTDNTITLDSLSKNFNTNSSYLSKTINHYKENNFSTYLSSLRIEHCIAKLKTDKTLRSYTIKAIAQESGFKNSESFSKAFYKTTGIYPSFFIKQIEKQQKAA